MKFGDVGPTIIASICVIKRKNDFLRNVENIETKVPQKHPEKVKLKFPDHLQMYFVRTNFSNFPKNRPKNPRDDETWFA